MGVNGVYVFARRVAHQGFADFLHDARFHEPGVKGVPEIVKPAIADSRAAHRRLPRGLDLLDRVRLEGEDESRVLPLFGEKPREAFRKRYLAALPSGGLRLGDKEQVPAEIDVFPQLVEEFAAPHAGIERRYDDRAEVGSGGSEQSVFVRAAEDRARLAPLGNKAKPRERIRGEEPLVLRPVEDVAQGLEVAVHGRVGDGLRRVTPPSVVGDDRFVNPPDLNSAPVGKQDLQAVEVPGARPAFGEKPGGEFPEGHLGLGFDDLVARARQVFFEALLDRQGETAVAGSRRLRMADAVLKEIAPVHVSAFIEAHGFLPPFCCWRARSQ